MEDAASGGAAKSKKKKKKKKKLEDEGVPAQVRTVEQKTIESERSYL